MKMMTFNFRAIIAMALMSVVNLAWAQTLVVDPEGEPMSGTVVIDNDGDPVGCVDADGFLPELSKSLYPLTLSCMGFERTVVNEPIDTVVMNALQIQLPEVEVRPGDRPAMYVVCYIREVSSMTDYIDSICVTSQYMVDYMLPAYKGAKCKTWNAPRILTSKVDVRYTMVEAPDKSDLKIMSWYEKFAKLSNNPTKLPGELKGKTQGTVNRMKKGVGCVYRLTPATYSVSVDGLVGRKDHKFSMPVVNLFGFSTDMTEFWEQRTFSYSEDGVYDLTNTTGMAYALRLEGVGKGWKSFFPSEKTPVNIYTYIEIYPVEICYLTKAEAADLKKNKPRCPLQIPTAAKGNE